MSQEESLLEVYLRQNLKLACTSNILSPLLENDELSRDFSYQYEESMMPSFLLRDPNSTRFLLEQDEIDMTPKRPKQTIAIPTLYPPLLPTPQTNHISGSTQRVTLKRVKKLDRPIGIFNKGKKSACVKKGSMEGTTYPHLAFSEDTFFSRLKSPRANQEKLHENRDTIFRLQEESVMMGKISPIHYSKITKLETSPIYPDRNVNFPDHVALKNISDNRSPVFLKADNYQKSPNPFLDTQPEFSIAPPKTQLSKIKFTGHYRELVQEYTATEESFPTMTNLKETLKNSAGLQIDTISGSKSTSSISTSSHSSFSAETFINFKDQYEKRVEEKTLERMKEMWRPRKLY